MRSEKKKRDQMNQGVLRLFMLFKVIAYFLELSILSRRQWLTMERVVAD